MNYDVRRRGQNLGVFSLEELRRRREAGELAGNDYVQAEGMSDWQPLDLVLQQGYRVTPPPLPSSVSSSGTNHILVWGIVAIGVFFFLIVIGLTVKQARRGYLSAINQSHSRNLNQSRPSAMVAASKPIIWTTNTMTAADVSRRAREFRTRQWLDGYEKRGQRNPSDNAEVMQFLQTWLARNYGGAAATNKMVLEEECDKLAADTNCTDPLVLTLLADNSLNHFGAVHRFERALDGFPQSSHKSYPRFYAAVRLANSLDDQPNRVAVLDASAVELFRKCFADGSIIPADQQEIADIFVNGWGYNFFYRNADSICKIAHEAGTDYQWLALVLDGENNIIAAWRARGGGYTDTVTQEGWRGFNSHLASARFFLTKAWNLRPDFPLAPCRMIYVSLGDSDITEMRTWFDRTLAAQIDYPRAWSDLRWGLRPRWYGDERSMLALGRTAINTARYDTDVPRKFLDCVYDVESEEGVSAGHHIFGRSDIWPDLQRMYEGYIAAPSQAQYRDGWRTSFAVVAYFAGKYDVSRLQLEALDWKLLPENMAGWNVDLSLMALEVAARTGSQGRKISAAEYAFNNGDVPSALKKYTALDTANADARTKEFIQLRLAALQFSQHLQNGQWVDFLPQKNDPNWVFSFGNARRLQDGALEVESGAKGHMLFSRMSVGANFEIKGQFEVVHSSNKNFQGGVVMGVPNFDGYNWYGFRIKRHDEEGDVVSIGRGWSRTQIVRHVVLNDVTNSFDFTFQNGKATALVNGHEVFHQANPPADIVVPDNSFMLGLGAFNDSTNTVIRYRDVRIRKLD
jgi:hypothetical protein